MPKQEQHMTIEMVVGPIHSTKTIRHLNSRGEDADRNFIKAHRELSIGDYTSLTHDEIEAYNRRHPNDVVPFTSFRVTDRRVTPHATDSVLTLHLEPVAQPVSDDTASAAPGDGEEIKLTVLTHEGAHVILKTPPNGLSGLKVVGPSTAWELDVHLKNDDYQKLADYFAELARRFPQT